MRSSLTVLTLVLIIMAASVSVADVPTLINYQGRLTNTGGEPVDAVVDILFSICSDSLGSACAWSELQEDVEVTDGLFNVKLGSVTPITDLVFSSAERWLGINVGGEAMPYTQLVTVPYAFRVSTVDGASGGEISGKLNVGYSNTNSGANAFVTGVSNSVSGMDAVISGGNGNEVIASYGAIGGGLTNDVDSEYGVVGGGWSNRAAGSAATVAGGKFNYISNSFSTIAGGESNSVTGAHTFVGGGQNHNAGGGYSVIAGGFQSQANGDYCTVGGGRVNKAYNTAATVAGGWLNEAGGQYSGVLGGAENIAGGDYSAILGGYGDTIMASGDYSFLFGIGSKLSADSTFMVDMPHIRFGDEATGYEFPTADGSTGQVLATNGSGGLNWTTGGSGGGGGWTDDGAVVRLDAVADEVGVGTVSPDAKLHVHAAQDHAGRFTSSVGTTDSAVFTAQYLGGGDIDAVAVRGISRPNDFWGIGGRFESNYVGVEGIAYPGGTSDAYAYIGMVGEARGGIARNEGVRGIATNCWGATGASGTAINGSEWTIGVSGSAYNSSAPTSTGVFGASVASGTFSYGVSGFAIDSPSTWGYGVYGQAHSSTSGNYGVVGSAQLNSGSKRGVYGTASGAGSNFALYGLANDAAGSQNFGIYAAASGASTENWAGVFDGNVDVMGTLSKDAGSFRIDHPLDPENKYLQHSFVESPDMMNVYNGNVTTNAEGRAVITMPDYFDALNSDFRYQLTVIGTFAQAIIEQEIEGAQFVIATDQPNVKVSWQVTGIRKDRYAEAHRIHVELDKQAHEQGNYRHPELFGFGAERGIDKFEEAPENEQLKQIIESREGRVK